jgi:hypothetical protein
MSEVDWTWRSALYTEQAKYLEDKAAELLAEARRMRSMANDLDREAKKYDRLAKWKRS